MVVNSKRIAKNTVFMYLRLLITIPIAFYTSRIVLKQLGVDDFGVYQAVAGIISMFTILRGAFDSATQRYYNDALAKDDNSYLSEIFTASLVVHIAITLLLLLLIEFFGLWFIENEMQYPAGSKSDVLFVFHTTVCTVVFIIMTIPFTGMVIAREHINFYAYLAILDVVLKLLLVLLLIFVDTNKLRIYAVFQMCVPIIIFLLTTGYFLKFFKDVRIKRFSHKTFISMANFSGWGLIGNVCYSLVNEGVNLLLNVFGGVVVNTARGIAYQVRTVINNITTSTITPLRPQATQLFIRAEYKPFWELIYSYSRYLFLIASILNMPLIIYAQPILYLWLGQTPPYSILFLQLLMLYTLVRSFHEPMDIVYKASGRMKTYQLKTVSISSMTFLLSWLFLKYGFPIYTPFVIFTIIEAILLFALVFNARKEGISPYQYFYSVIRPCLIYIIMVAFWGLLSYYIIDVWFLSAFITVIGSLSLAYFIGLNKCERAKLKTIVISRFSIK